MTAIDTQVGGGHYKGMAIQPVEYIHGNGIGFMEGCAIKYLSRWRAKNGIEDLHKAAHFIQLLIELEERALSARDAALAANDAPVAEVTDAEWPKMGDTVYSWNNQSYFLLSERPWSGTERQIEWLANGELFRTPAEAEAEWNRRFGKAEETPDPTPLACPTGVPENGDWMPKDGEAYWMPGRPGASFWMFDPIDRKRLDDGNVCRTRDIARAVQKRRIAGWPECSGDPSSCPENEGYGCCGGNGGES